MNVTSLELSKQLYELSGRETGGKVWLNGPVKPYLYDPDPNMPEHVDYPHELIGPAYDSGFLLRELSEQRPALRLRQMAGGRWWAYCEWGEALANAISKEQVDATADTPEDALAQLAITLINQGILPGRKSE